MSPGNMLRLAVPGLTPRPASLAKLRQVTVAGDHLDPRVTEDEREVVRELADALDMDLLDFVTLSICRLVGAPYLTKLERQEHAAQRNRDRIEARRATKTAEECARAQAKCDRYAAIKAEKSAPRRNATCSPLADTDSRWPTGMSGPDDLRAEWARRRAHIESAGDRRDRDDEEFRKFRRLTFRRKMGMAA